MLKAMVCSASEDESAAMSPVSPPVLLVLRETTRPINLRLASHLRLASSCGFLPIIVSWRQVRAGTGETQLMGGVSVTSDCGLRRVTPGTRITPAVILHRCLLGRGCEQLLERLAENHTSLRLSYGSSWKIISRKWTGELCFRNGELAGITVARPDTYLVRKAAISRRLRHIAMSRPLIFKPSTGSQCYGISLSTPRTFASVSRRLRRSAWPAYVAQDLVQNPVLYRGRKIDLRLYVLVTSFRPLQMRLYRQGVARIAARPFAQSSADDGLAALTGCSYRKRKHQSIDNVSVTTLLHQLECEGYRVASFWEDVERLLQDVFRCLGGYSGMEHTPHLQRRFYLGGVDVLLTDLDGVLKPLFIETNHVPQLNGWGPQVDLALRAVHRAWLSDLRALCAASI
jgi:hypothetical protein